VRIAVLVKQVPDTYGDRKIDVSTGLVDRAASEAVIDEIGERAMEAALTIRSAVEGSTVTAVTMGPESAADGVRRMLAMGADDGVHVVDDALAGADLTLTAEVLAAAVRTLNADLVLTGNVSTDGAGGVMAALLAEHLGLPHATNLSALEVDGAKASGSRVTEAGVVQVEAPLPAVVSITEALPDPRLPSFKGIREAKKKTVVTLSASELGADVAGAQAARAIVIAAAQRPPRSAGVKIVDEGDGGRQLAEFLIKQNLA
jgi:electron transfer flavoprotein beta subunit